MSAFKHRTASIAALRVQGRIKLARLLELPERAVEDRIREIETDPLFRRLTEEGVLSVQALPGIRFMARSCQGFELSTSDDGVAELLDGDSDVARLMKRIGQEDFERCFLADEGSSDAERARLCGVSQAEARSIREFMDRLYVRSEFQSSVDQSPPATVYSSVAGITLEDGRPVLGFFNREIWKGRYRTDEERYRGLKETLTPSDAARIEQFMRQTDLLAFRQTTLHRVLEALIERQADYLASGDPARRRPLTQREVATSLRVAPSVLNQLIANKSVAAPWRLEIPLKAFMPSRKVMTRDKLYDIAMERPDAGDDLLRKELRRLHGTLISRPSIIQYRKELGLGVAGQRGSSRRTGAGEALPS
jgi:hypothetical protein